MAYEKKDNLKKESIENNILAHPPSSPEDVGKILKQMDKTYNTTFYDWIRDPANAGVIAFKAKDKFINEYHRSPGVVFCVLKFLCQDWKLSKIAELLLKLFYQCNVANSDFSTIVCEMSISLSNTAKVDLISLLLIGEEAGNTATFLYHYFHHMQKKLYEQTIDLIELKKEEKMKNNNKEEKKDSSLSQTENTKESNLIIDINGKSDSSLTDDVKESDLFIKDEDEDEDEDTEFNETEFMDEMNAFCSGVLECLFTCLKWNNDYFRELILKYVLLSTTADDERRDFLIRMVNVKYHRFQQSLMIEQHQRQARLKYYSQHIDCVITDDEEEIDLTLETEESENKNEIKNETVTSDQLNDLSNSNIQMDSSDNKNSKMKNIGLKDLKEKVNEEERLFKKSVDFGILIFNMFQTVMRTEIEELMTLSTPISSRPETPIELGGHTSNQNSDNLWKKAIETNTSLHNGNSENQRHIPSSLSKSTLNNDDDDDDDDENINTDNTNTEKEENENENSEKIIRDDSESTLYCEENNEINGNDQTKVEEESSSSSSSTVINNQRNNNRPALTIQIPEYLPPNGDRAALNRILASTNIPNNSNNNMSFNNSTNRILDSISLSNSNNRTSNSSTNGIRRSSTPSPFLIYSNNTNNWTETNQNRSNLSSLHPLHHSNNINNDSDFDIALNTPHSSNPSSSVDFNYPTPSSYLNTNLLTSNDVVATDPSSTLLFSNNNNSSTTTTTTLTESSTTDHYLNVFNTSTHSDLSTEQYSITLSLDSPSPLAQSLMINSSNRMSSLHYLENTSTPASTTTDNSLSYTNENFNYNQILLKDENNKI